MPSKKSKVPNTRSPWKRVSDCSEKLLSQLAQELALELRPGDRVILEGPMGVGKTTFARQLITALGILQPPEGSPSFALAHEYDSPKGQVIHLDFYRIRDESEIDDAGIPTYYWEREPSPIVISEWLSNWPEFAAHVHRSGRCWEVTLEYSEQQTESRSVEIWEPESLRGPNC